MQKDPEMSVHSLIRTSSLLPNLITSTKPPDTSPSGREREADRECMTQDLRSYDRGVDHLFRNLHALLHGRYSEELSAVGLPHDKLGEPIDPGDKVSEVLEVS